MIKLDDKYILKFSSMVDRLDHFYIGNFDGLKFVKEKEVYLKLPKNYYASQIFKYNNSNIIIGWIHNDDYKTNKEYNGILSIPRILYLDNNILKTKPIDSIYVFVKENRITDNDIIEEF